MPIIRLFKWLAVVGVLLCFIALAFALAVTERQPLVISEAIVSPEIALQAEQVAQRTRRVYLKSELDISADEANALITIARRVYPDVNARVNIANDQLLAAVSVPLFNRRYYLNITAIVLPSSSQLQLDYVKIGRVQLPGWLALGVAERLVNGYFRSNQSSQLLNAIQQVHFDHDRVIVQYQWPEQLEINTMLRMRDEWQPYGDPKDMHHYYRLLAMHPVESATVSLATYVELLFREAAAQYERKGNTSSAVAENQAALLALAVFVGTPMFELILGNVRGNLATNANSVPITLAQRGDLQSHFVYSAAIKAMTNRDIGFLAGEMKELLDTNPNGSGFSFADLMADKAGVRFAEIALQSEASARALQQKISQGLTEQQLLPDISAMPEGIDYHQFRAEYDTVESAAYRDMLTFIEQELNALPLYQGH